MDAKTPQAVIAVRITLEKSCRVKGSPLAWINKGLSPAGLTAKTLDMSYAGHGPSCPVAGRDMTVPLPNWAVFGLRMVRVTSEADKLTS